MNLITKLNLCPIQTLATYSIYVGYVILLLRLHFLVLKRTLPRSTEAMAFNNPRQ